MAGGGSNSPPTPPTSHPSPAGPLGSLKCDPPITRQRAPTKKKSYRIRLPNGRHHSTLAQMIRLTLPLMNGLRSRSTNCRNTPRVVLFFWICPPDCNGEDAAVNRLAKSITQLTLCQVTTDEVDAATRVLSGVVASFKVLRARLALLSVVCSGVGRSRYT